MRSERIGWTEMFVLCKIIIIYDITNYTHLHYINPPYAPSLVVVRPAGDRRTPRTQHADGTMSSRWCVMDTFFLCDSCTYAQLINQYK